MRYQCNQCKEHFEGDHATYECPHCGYTEFTARPLKKEIGLGNTKERERDVTKRKGKKIGNPTIVDLNKENSGKALTGRKRGFLISVSLIILILLIMRFCTGACENPNGNHEEMDPTQSVALELRLEKTGNPSTYHISVRSAETKKELPLRSLLRLYKSQGEEQLNFNLESGEVYFCDDMNGLTVALQGDINFNGSVYRIKANRSSLISLSNSNPLAFNCNDRSEETTIREEVRLPCEDDQANLRTDEIVVLPIDNCKIQIDLGIYSECKPLVSINGRGGDYRSEFIWDIEDKIGQPIDVWVQIEEKDPIPYRENGEWTIPECTNEARLIIENAMKYLAEFEENPSRDNLDNIIDIISILIIDDQTFKDPGKISAQMKNISKKIERDEIESIQIEEEPELTVRVKTKSN